MSLDKGSTWKQLSDLWADNSVKILESRGKKYAIISDTHMGDGGDADDFAGNEAALLSALDHYQKNNYNLILLGDVEELWQFDLSAIVNKYDKTIYAKIREFGDDRVQRIFGNHDYEWGGFEDPSKKKVKKSGLAEEALKMKDRTGKMSILFVHGHQGSIDSDKFSWFSRFFVRTFKIFEPLAKATGLYGHGSATKSRVTRDYERIYYRWAKKNKVVVICGHSHRAIFAARSYADQLRDEIADLKVENSMSGKSRKTKKANQRKIDRLQDKWDDEREKGRTIEPTETMGEPLPCYFNSGCGLYTDGITNLEIDDDKIKLVKWNNETVDGPPFVVFNEGSLSEFVKKATA
jgi:UDP-2,3-diacylglucosamine pyrophosphatase LpxH